LLKDKKYSALGFNILQKIIFFRMDTTRQNKVSKLIQHEISMILLRRGNEFPGKLISVTVVRVSPDLSLAKIYLSIFPAENSQETLQSVRETTSGIRYDLGNIIKNQVRKIPELAFFLDDSMDYAARIDELLKN
jgi:ribosome-binding factor A